MKRRKHRTNRPCMRPAVRYLCPVKLRIGPKYARLEPYLRSLPQTCDNPGQGRVLHVGRNTIKAFEWNGIRVVAKRYGKISLLNRIVYGTLRRSKAWRAFDHAARLRRLGIDTPEEVGRSKSCGAGNLRTANSYRSKAATALFPISGRASPTKRSAPRCTPLRVFYACCMKRTCCIAIST